jgi:hypothetical protein
MSSISICTLFEGHYHYGVAGLVNSLYLHGFEGNFYAGYKGSIPAWANGNIIESNLDWPGSHSVAVGNKLQLHFLPLDTHYHLTNYKPDFMLRLLDSLAKDTTGILYFDPDIVIDAPWFFFKDWIKCGVALCEDVNSPLTKNHPTRVAWRSYFSNYGFNLKFKDPIYVNGGFTGVHINNRSFLELWKSLQEAMAPAIGGLDRSAFQTGLQLPETTRGPFSPFGKTDQDALNATVEAWSGEFSLITQEGMGFRNGLTIMPHALGRLKPWKWNPIKQSLLGKPPRLVDRKYWQYSKGPLKAHSEIKLNYKKVSLKIASLISRFIKK